MALLKVFKGLEANLPNTYEEGRLLFTTDSGKLFLDLDNNQRVQIGVGADSPVFTGTPTAPTPTEGDNTQTLATTAFVKTAVDNKAIDVDSALSDTSENPVQNKIIKTKTDSIDSNISTINASLNNKVDKVSGKGLSTNDFTTALKNKLDGIAAGATAVSVDASLSSTSTNPVQNKAINTALGLKANLASPALSGTPTAPTATDNTNTTQIATTAFVQKAVSTKSDSTHTHSTTLATSTGTSALALAYGTKYALGTGGTSTIFTTPALGTTATTAAAGNHTHSTTITTSTGTNQLTLAASTKYAITAGGTSYIFTTPPNTTYSSMSASEMSTGTATTGRLITAATLATYYQKKAVTTTASLAVASWSNKTITVSITGVTASNTVMISPEPDSVSAWAAAGVYCSAQAAGTLTFTCTTTPTVALTANIIILN